ncbi:MAG TPA: hypothetical protein ENK57_04655 [Polyangiaceae bacterium]|nr:hypothetical protein [Polyangiaceae bacterium]
MSSPFRIERESLHAAVRQLDLILQDSGGIDRFALMYDKPMASERPPVFFSAAPRSQLTDFPFTTNGWPVFSARVAACFGEDAVTLPTTILHEDGSEDRSGYVLVMPRALVDGIDLARSTTTPNPFNPSAPPEIRVPVLRKEFSWPRFIRLEGYPVRMYVNHETRTALLALGATGIRFTRQGDR